jgi:type II secretory pathway pseudopilin PulG
MKTMPRTVFAFSLIEVTLALGVASFCLLSILGLLPLGINSHQASIQQTAAASLATAILSDLRVSQVNVPATSPSRQYQIPIPAAGAATNLVSTIFLRENGSVAQNGSPTVVNANADPSQDPRYRATIIFLPPANAEPRTATQVRILITWPALADPQAGSSPAKYSGYSEILSSLDRN